MKGFEALDRYSRRFGALGFFVGLLAFVPVLIGKMLLSAIILFDRSATGFYNSRYGTDKLFLCNPWCAIRPTPCPSLVNLLQERVPAERSKLLMAALSMAWAASAFFARASRGKQHIAAPELAAAVRERVKVANSASCTTPVESAGRSWFLSGRLSISHAHSHATAHEPTSGRSLMRTDQCLRLETAEEVEQLATAIEVLGTKQADKLELSHFIFALSCVLASREGGTSTLVPVERDSDVSLASVSSFALYSPQYSPAIETLPSGKSRNTAFGVVVGADANLNEDCPA